MARPGDTTDPWARWCLYAGVVIGLLLTVIGLLHSRKPPTDVLARAPGEGVAVVNGYPIATEIYAQVLGGVAMEREGQELGRAERQRVLDRLIDEELLVQRGLELDFARTDRILRRQIVTALTTSLTAEAAELSPTTEELQHFYREHQELFMRTDRLSFVQLFVRVSSAAQDSEGRQRAAQAVQRLRGGEAFAVVNKELGDEPILRLPESPLPLEKIQEYLGPTVMQALVALQPGAVSEPIRSGTGYHVLVLHERRPGEVPPFATIREIVLAQYRRAAGEKAVAAYIADLRTRAHIEIGKTWETVEGTQVMRSAD